METNNKDHLNYNLNFKLIKNIMQSYEHHIVEESLQARHPYLQEDFSSDVQPDQITVAVFDRTIDKFKEVLLQTDLEAGKCRDALKTLNELIHH